MFLWSIIEDVAGAAISRSRAGTSRGSCDAEDLRQDFFVYLLERASTFATAFRGTSEPELRRYLWVTAVRFMRKRRGRARRVHARESEAIARRGVEHPSPSDVEIALFASELDTLLTETERAHLLVVRDSTGSEIAPPCDGPSARTVRRWSEAIFAKYARRIV